MERILEMIGVGGAQGEYQEGENPPVGNGPGCCAVHPWRDFNKLRIARGRMPGIRFWESRRD